VSGPLPLDVLMPVVMARQVKDGDWASHGASVPLAGAALFLAMETHARDVDIWIQGCVNPTNRNLADALLDPNRIFETAEAHMNQTEIINFSLRGNATFQFLRPLQVDRHGNVNVSLAERPGKPSLRFHGVAVGDALNAVGRVCLYVTEHSERTFPEKLSFRTGTGHDDGSRWREGTGLPVDAGPDSVVTPLALLGFDESRRLEVRSLHPGVTLEQVQESTGFEIGAADTIHETPAPTEEELAALEKVDPDGVRRLEFGDTRAEALRFLGTREGTPPANHPSRGGR
jgi:glutaconate CoA-transferase subunit B